MIPRRKKVGPTEAEKLVETMFESNGEFLSPSLEKVFEEATAKVKRRGGLTADEAHRIATATGSHRSESENREIAAHAIDRTKPALLAAEAPLVEQEHRSESLGPWGVIIEDIVRIDVAETYLRLRDDLSLGELAHAYGEVAAALDSADRNYHDAVLLSRAAKLEQERVEREVQTQLEVLRSAARAELEKEKRAAVESKSKSTGRATLEEVRDRMLASWPDKMSYEERRLEEMHGARAACDGLVQSWSSRAQSLRKLADRVALPGTR